MMSAASAGQLSRLMYSFLFFLRPMTSSSGFAFVAKNIHYKLSVAEPIRVVDPSVAISPTIFRERWERWEKERDGGREG